MGPMGIVEILKLSEFSPKIRRTPERHLVEILAPERTDEPFDERVGERDIRDGLDFIDLEHPQVRPPAVKFEQRIVIGAEVTRQRLSGDGEVEHPANRHAIENAGMHAAADDVPRVLVHDEQYPVAAQGE